MRILVLGGTGFIGRHVVERLIASPHTIGSFHRGRTHSSAGVVELRGDRDRSLDVQEALRQFRPDTVVDMILSTETQAQGLVEACRGSVARLVVISSADVYRHYDGLRGKSAVPPDPTPLGETAPLRETRFPYRGHGLAFDHADGYDKILVEQAVSVPDLPSTILRLPAVYGPGDHENRRIQSYLKRMADGRPCILLAEEQASWRWTRGYVENVAAAIALAATDSRAVGHTYNVGEEPTLTEREWVERIGDAFGWQGKVVTVPAAELPEPLRRPFDWRYHLETDTTRIRKELDYVEPVTAEDAMLRTVQWEKARLDEKAPPDYGPEDEFLSRSERLSGR